MDKITNPHDKFFKEVFTHQETAEDFLANYLPTEVVGLLDLDSLECSKDTYIDKNLEAYFSDLLFKLFLKDGSRGYIYILIEHKSYQDAMTR
jgi:predicted transposase/invertase (TIGR01784 family)